MTGVVQPLAPADALRDVARLTVAQMKTQLKSLHASADGNKAALATRLAQLFGPQYVSPADPAVGDQLRRRAAAVVHDDEFMYDLADDDDARTTHGEAYARNGSCFSLGAVAA